MVHFLDLLPDLGERHIQTKFSKVQAPVSLTMQVHVLKPCVRFKYPIEEYTWSIA